MIGHLLLYLLVNDLRDFSDSDLYDVLEVLLGLPGDCEDLREAVLDQLEEGVLDRQVIAAWPEEFCHLLPAQMAGYTEALESFRQLLEATPDPGDGEEGHRLARFRLCLDMLDEDSDWKQRSLAARGLGVLEEELFALRDDYVRQPVVLQECSAASVVAHQQLLQGFEIWQQAIRLTHEAQLDEAYDRALDACRLFRAVEVWSRN